MLANALPVSVDPRELIAELVPEMEIELMNSATKRGLNYEDARQAVQDAWLATFQKEQDGGGEMAEREPDLRTRIRKRVRCQLKRAIVAHFRHAADGYSLRHKSLKRLATCGVPETILAVLRTETGRKGRLTRKTSRRIFLQRLEDLLVPKLGREVFEQFTGIIVHVAGRPVAEEAIGKIDEKGEASHFEPVDYRERGPLENASEHEIWDFKAWKQLSEEDQWLLKELICHERSAEDVAAKLGCTSNAIGIRKLRALGKLRALLEERPP